MYRPLPDGLTIKHSPIEGLGLFTDVDTDYTFEADDLNLEEGGSVEKKANFDWETCKRVSCCKSRWERV